MTKLLLSFALNRSRIVIQAFLMMVCFLLAVPSRAQVSTYSFSQSAGTYGTYIGAGATAAGGAALNDDNSYTTTALPFAFNYGGTTYPAGSTIGINANGWIRLAGAVVASSYTVTSDASNFQTVAAFNRDLQEQRLATTTGTWTAGSTTMTVASAANFAVGMKLNGATAGTTPAGIPAGTIVTAIAGTTITLSQATTAAGTNVTVGAASSLTIWIVGTAPNRSFVFQWVRYRRFAAAVNQDNYNFQIWLNEGGGVAANQTVQTKYGTCTSTSATAITPMVGLKGLVVTDFNARSMGTWAASIAATANTQTMSHSNTVFPASGTTYTWTPGTSCTGTPNAGVATISSASGCPSANFSLGATGITTGVGITYQWQSGPTATGPWTNIAGGTTVPYTTSTAATTFYRLVTTCTSSTLTNTSTVVSYTPGGGLCACGAYPALWATATADEDITNVTVSTINNSSVCGTVAPGAGSVAFRYSNYTGAVAAASEAQGNVVNFSLTQTTCGGAYANFFQIYVDWNQDGDWLDAGEQVYSQAASVTGNQTATGTFTVPFTATVGTTRMRVVNIEATAATTNYAHTAYTWGETEDYCFTVTPTLGCTGTPNAGSAAISSASGCSGVSFNLSATGLTNAAGITYQWQSAPTAGGPWTNIAGATTPTYAATATGTTYYQLVTTCTNTSTSNTTNVVSYTVIPCCTYSFLLTDAFGDGWNGATMEIRNGPTVIATLGGTFTTGTLQTLNIPMGQNVTYTLFYTNAGAYPTEVGIQILDPNGMMIYNLAAGAGTVGTTLFTWTPNCAPPPTGPTSVTASANPMCSGNTITLNANGGTGTVYWFTAGCNTSGQIGTGSSISVSPVNTTTYYARTFDGVAWSTTCASLTVTVNTTPTVNAGSGSTICVGNNAQLNATASATATASGTLTTTFAGGNGCGAGNMFDLTAGPSQVSVNAFTITPLATAIQTVNVYYKVGTYVGSEINAAAWTLVGSYSVNGTAAVPILMPITSIVIPAATTYGIYVQYNAQYTNGANTYSNADLTMVTGAGHCTGFDGCCIPRTFNGIVHYTVTSSTTPTVTWTPAATLSSSSVLNPVATPSATTTYTVTASNGGCNSTSTVTVTVTPTPVSPTASPQTICYGANAQITASATADWYTTPIGGTLIGTAQTFTTPALTANTTYYIEGVANGCPAAPRNAVNVTVNPFPNTIPGVNAAATGCNIYAPNAWTWFVNPSNDIVACVWSGANLNAVSADVQVLSTVPYQNGVPYIPRIVTITPGAQGSAQVRLYYTLQEFQMLQALNPLLTSHSQLGVTKFDNSNMTGNPLFLAPTAYLTPAQTGMTDVYAVEVLTPSFSTFAIHFNYGNTILPVEFTSLTAECASTGVKVEWSTASETQCSHYNVYRSSDGINYTFVTTVAGAGTTSEPHNYSVYDMNAVSGVNYYRVDQVDINGTTKPAPLVSATCETLLQRPELAPNPADESSVLIFPSDKESILNITILNSEGIRIETQQATLSEGRNTIYFNWTDYPAGLYLIRTEHDGEQNEFKQMVIE